jgi:hypothetical protein
MGDAQGIDARNPAPLQRVYRMEWSCMPGAMVELFAIELIGLRQGGG